MSNFAKIHNNIVTEVIVADTAFINSGAVGDSSLWVETSYNADFRGKFAGIGDTWNSVNDVFISPQPYPSWSLGSDFTWQPPTDVPDATDGILYDWNEDTLSWKFLSSSSTGQGHSIR